MSVGVKFRVSIMDLLVFLESIGYIGGIWGFLVDLNSFIGKFCYMVYVNNKNKKFLNYF